LPATALAERVGWTGSITWFRDNVRRLRPEHRRPDPADRLVCAPGDAAHFDLWFPPKRIPLEDGATALLPVLVIVAAHSRFFTATMLPTRQTPDLLLGMWSLVAQFGRVPRRLIWDNEAGIGKRNRLAHGVGEFCGTLATRLHQLKPHDPQSKGIVERRNGFFETSFMPGRTSTRRPTSTCSSARVVTLRTRLTDPYLEPAVLQLGRRVRRPSRRRRNDRPHRPPRRRAHPERHQLPAPQPRHRHPPQHQATWLMERGFVPFGRRHEAHLPSA